MPLTPERAQEQYRRFLLRYSATRGGPHLYCTLHEAFVVSSSDYNSRGTCPGQRTYCNGSLVRPSEHLADLKRLVEYVEMNT